MFFTFIIEIPIWWQVQFFSWLSTNPILDDTIACVAMSKSNSYQWISQTCSAANTFVCKLTRGLSGYASVPSGATLIATNSLMSATACIQLCLGQSGTVQAFVIGQTCYCTTSMQSVSSPTVPYGALFTTLQVCGGHAYQWCGTSSSTATVYQLSK